MVRSFLFLLLFYFRFQISYAQIISEQRLEKYQTFTYHHASDNITNTILQEIARSQSKSVHTTRIQLHYTLYIQLKRLDNKQLEVLIEVHKPFLTGDVFYRNIDIQHILVPFNAEFRCAMECNSTIYVTFQDSAAILQGSMGYYQMLKKTVNDTACNNWFIDCSKIILRWNASTLEKFRLTAQIINEYYATDRILNDIENQLLNIDINRKDKYPFYAVVMNDLQKKIEQLESRNYVEVLELWKQDPIRYSERVHSIQNQLFSLRQFINKQLEHFDKVLFELAVQYKQQRQIDSMLWYLDRSILFNPVYAPSLTEKAMWLAQNDNVDSALTIFQYIYQFTFIPDYYTQQFQAYLPILMQLTEKKVTELLYKEEYNQAEALLLQVLELCKREDLKAYQRTFEQYLAQAKYGLYRSILIVVERALEFKKVQLAYEYLQRALAYQRQNKNYIITSIDALKYYEPIVNLCLQLINQSRNNKQFERALDLTEWLQNICDSLQPYCNQQILDSLFQLNTVDLFLKRLDDISRHIERNEFSIARTRLQVLEEFMKQYPFLSQNQQYLDIQYRIHYHAMHQEISYALQNIQHAFWLPSWNALYQAKKIQIAHNLKTTAIDSLTQLIQANVLNEFFLNMTRDTLLLDPEIIYGNILNFEEQLKVLGVSLDNEQRTRFMQIKFSIQSKICKKIMPVYERHFKDLDALVNKFEFEKAYQYLQGLRNTFEPYEYCHMIRQKLNDYEYKLNEAIIYVNQQQLLQGFLMMSDWENAIRQIEILNALASQPVLRDWNLKTYTIVDVVKNQKSIEFALFAFDYLFEQKRWDECFQILENLKKFQYPLRNSKSMQEELGKKIAVRDKLNNPKANYKLNILRYTEGDEYFSYFSKAYRKTWKKHRI